MFGLGPSECCLSVWIACVVVTNPDHEACDGFVGIGGVSVSAEGRMEAPGGCEVDCVVWCKLLQTRLS